MNQLTPPAYLNDDAKEEFNRVIKFLGNRLNPLDYSLLIDYSEAFADVIFLRALVDVEGMRLMSERGGLYLNPTITLLMNRRSLLATLRKDLGFTPNSRREKPTGRGRNGRGSSLYEQIAADGP